MMDHNEIFLLTSEQVTQYWPQIMELLSDTPWLTDLYHDSDIYELVQTGQFQIWALSDGVVHATLLTRIHCFPKKKIFEVIGVKGSRLKKHLDELQDVMEMLARSVGADELRAVVRPGMEKWLKQRGSSRVAIWVKRELESVGVQ